MDKIALGVMGLCMNIGTRYIFLDVPPSIDLYLTKYFALRIFVLLLLFFSITRDLWISIALTLLFIIVVKYLLNHDSPFFLLNRENMKNLKEDFESKKKVSQEEYENAKKTVERFRSQQVRG